MSESVRIKGVAEEMELYDDRVVITPKGIMGFLAKGIKGSKEIPFRSITAIQFKEAGTILSGYIQFTLPGGTESKSGILAATSDENTFVFDNKANDEMKKVKIFIQERIGKSEHKASSSLADEILKLKKLKDEGALTEAEFNDFKKKLVG